MQTGSGPISKDRTTSFNTIQSTLIQGNHICLDRWLIDVSPHIGQEKSSRTETLTSSHQQHNHNNKGYLLSSHLLMCMATIFPSSAILPSSSSSSTSTSDQTSPSKPPKPTPSYLKFLPSKQSFTKLTATTTLATILATTPLFAEASTTAYRVYYGTAASAANYGGYGGNSSKQDSAEYVYDVPEGWKERLVSKVEKGTNGTDSEFYNPKKKSEREYLTFLSGFRQLAPKDAVLNNLALSDVDLLDLIANAESLSSEEKKDEKGQLYYVYEINGTSTHSLISVTCAKNKLYAHFVDAPTPEWNRDQDMLRHVHESFKTVGSY